MRQLFRAYLPASLIGLILSEILLLSLCYIAGSWLVEQFFNPTLDLRSYLFYEGGLIQTEIVVLCIVFGLYLQNLYSNIGVRSVTVIAQQVCLVLGLAFLAQALLAYLRKPEWCLPRWAMIFGSIAALVLVPLWRVAYSRLVVKVFGVQRTLFLGVSPISQDIAAHLVLRPEIGMSVIGYVDDVLDSTPLPGGKLLGQIDDLVKVVQKYEPDIIVVGLVEGQKELPMAEMLRLRFSGVRFEDAVSTFEATFGRVSTRQMRPSRLVFSSDPGLRKTSLFWHSLYSYPICVLILALFAPIMVIVALLVRITSRGPIFYRQVRVGLNGRTFTIYKFRSMYVDAEALTGAVWAQRGDPRITPLGHWIRRLRLDELPQLLNVLRNDMALVGPRPERPEFVKSLVEKIPYYQYRHSVRPGITGWAQINYKYGDTVDDAIMKLEYDLYYIKNRAVSLDLFIIFHTMKVMFFSGMAQ